MYAKKMQRLSLVPMLLSLSCLSCCAQTSYEICPVYPIAGEKVAAEIADLNGPAFWEWLGRINKLRQQLEICNQLP